jgi:hypothetical protein
MDEVVDELLGLAADSQVVKYRSRVQVAVLRAAGEIRKLRAELLVKEAELWIASIQPADSAGEQQK